MHSDGSPVVRSSGDQAKPSATKRVWPCVVCDGRGCEFCPTTASWSKR